MPVPPQGIEPGLNELSQSAADAAGNDHDVAAR